MKRPRGTPIRPNGPTVRCKRCGRDVAPANQCSRCGALLPGNAMRVTHGLHRYETSGVLPPDLRQDIDEFRDALISDQGGLSDMTTLRAGLTRNLVDTEIMKRLMMNELVRQGASSAAGRRAYDRLLNAMDRWHRMATTLGLERRQKHVRTLDQILDSDEVADGD